MCCSSSSSVPSRNCTRWEGVSARERKCRCKTKNRQWKREKKREKRGGDMFTKKLNENKYSHIEVELEHISLDGLHLVNNNIFTGLKTKDQLVWRLLYLFREMVEKFNVKLNISCVLLSITDHLQVYPCTRKEIGWWLVKSTSWLGGDIFQWEKGQTDISGQLQCAIKFVWFPGCWCDTMMQLVNV